jgi:glycosyltransferase involved in cell wall biosynthesis
MTLKILTLKKDEPIDDFAIARNELMLKVKSDWILFVDSDEVVTPELEAEIQSAMKSDEYDAYYLSRLDTFMGKALKHGETGKARFIRLAKRNFGRWERPVHEVWVGKGKVGVLKAPLLHTPHQSIASFLDKINRYSTLEAEYRFEQGIKSSLFKIIVYPFAKFLDNYVFKSGFRDGTPGAIMAIMMSFHSYLTWTKLYLLWHKK